VADITRKSMLSTGLPAENAHGLHVRKELDANGMHAANTFVRDCVEGPKVSSNSTSRLQVAFVSAVNKHAM
jgi:hypothetical protein